MKKLLSMLLALIMVFSLATVAFAADNEEEATPNIPYNESRTLYKAMTINGTTAKMPAATFNFGTATKTGYATYDASTKTYVPATEPTGNVAPTVSVSAATFTAGQTTNASASVSVAGYENSAVGKYTYTLNETAGDVAGITYNNKPITVAVTVLYGDDGKQYVAAVYAVKDAAKNDTFTNTYDAGSLKITKKIDGSAADLDKKFQFTVTLTPENGKKFDTFVQVVPAEGTTTPVAESTSKSATEIKYVVELGNGASFTLNNIPVGTTYIIEEVNQGYVENQGSYDSEIVHVITNTSEKSYTWTNTLDDGNIDTGVITESAPYILLIAVCAVAAVLFVTKRRRVEF